MRLGPWGRRPKEEAPRPAPLAEAEEERELRFDCESCGASLTFQPGTTEITCAHCGHRNAIPDAEVPVAFEEIDYHATLARLEQHAELGRQRVVACQSCGAEFSLEPDSHAGACPYCGSDVVTDTGRDRPIKPAALAPFALDREQARQALRGWLKRLWFAPSGLAKFARREGALTGLYTPYWTFDAASESRYVGDRGTLIQVPRTIPGKGGPKTVMTTKIRWTRVSGRVARRFDDVLAGASANLPRGSLRGLAPWRLGELVAYREDYLAGFRSEAYQVELPEGFEDAKKTMQGIIKADVCADIGGHTQRIRRLETRYDAITFKHVLLPVWMAAYRYRGKAYQVLINGQTGRISGQRPYSAIKIALAALAALALLGVALYLFQTSGQ